MNDEKPTLEEEWEMSLPNVPTPKADLGTSGEWQMPEPVFRVSDGDPVKRTGERMITPAAVEAENVVAETDSVVQAQPDISEEFQASEIDDDARNIQTAAEARSAKGNAKWMVLLGGIFVFFAIVGGILIGAYFLFWKQ